MVSKNSALSKSFTKRFAGIEKMPSNYSTAICFGCLTSDPYNISHWFKILRVFNPSNWNNLQKNRFKEVFSQIHPNNFPAGDLELIMNLAIDLEAPPARKKNISLTKALASSSYCEASQLEALNQIYFSDLEVEVLLIWIRSGKGDLLQSYVNYICTNCPSDERSRKTSNWNSRKLPLTLAVTFLFSALTIYFLIGLASVPHYIAVVALLWFFTTMYSAMLFGL